MFIVSFVIGLMVVFLGCGYLIDLIILELIGFWSYYIVFLLFWIIIWFFDLFGGSYVVGIIVVIILICLFIMFLMIK